MKRVSKRYLALVDGVVSSDQGTIAAPIGRFPELKQWRVKQDGKLSESKFRVCERRSNFTLLELEPVTGRTNQLRIHCQMIGHPIVGDTERGGSEFGRLCLHSYRLEFPHPSTRAMMKFESVIQF
jgi:23S rRNA pseudouridine1911/1915/1917 synthase